MSFNALPPQRESDWKRPNLHRGPLTWKVLDGALDMLPNSAAPFTEEELRQWMDSLPLKPARAAQ